MSASDSRDAVKEILGSLKGIFGRYNRSARNQAWDGIQSAKGKAQVQKLLNSPTSPLVGTDRLVKFKEWMATQSF